MVDLPDVGGALETAAGGVADTFTEAGEAATTAVETAAENTGAAIADGAANVAEGAGEKLADAVPDAPTMPEGVTKFVDGTPIDFDDGTRGSFDGVDGAVMTGTDGPDNLGYKNSDSQSRVLGGGGPDKLWGDNVSNKNYNGGAGKDKFDIDGSKNVINARDGGSDDIAITGANNLINTDGQDGVSIHGTGNIVADQGASTIQVGDTGRDGYTTGTVINASPTGQTTVNLDASATRGTQINGSAHVNYSDAGQVRVQPLNPTGYVVRSGSDDIITSNTDGPLNVNGKSYDIGAIRQSLAGTNLVSKTIDPAGYGQFNSPTGRAAGGVEVAQNTTLDR